MEHDLETRFDRWRRHGDVRALEQVFDGAAPELLKLTLHLAPGASEAEDLVQATFLRALRLLVPRDTSWTVDVYDSNGVLLSVDGVAAGSHDLVWTLPR